MFLSSEPETIQYGSENSLEAWGYNTVELGIFPLGVYLMKKLHRFGLISGKNND